ncbi:hypothetical protein DY000_02059563 [Brassica cretica]|uniref:Uncharacterized protein n=1 Tax=Brassica cretica TaxID=69181 RepID=A0ABQ7AQW5_BRACR|nr:hypothetical protein DY000_02059563 [Brassica cretica]
MFPLRTAAALTIADSGGDGGCCCGCDDGGDGGGCGGCGVVIRSLFCVFLSSPSSVKSSVHLLRRFRCGEDPEQSKLRAGLDSAIVREKPNIKWTDVAAVLHRKETALASNGFMFSFTLVFWKVILESAILTTVVVLSLTVYTFWAAKGGYDFNFLGHSTTERPRMCVFRSNKHLYVQVIDDTKMHTLPSASTKQKPISGEFEYTSGPTIHHLSEDLCVYMIPCVSRMESAYRMWIKEKREGASYKNVLFIIPMSGVG